MSRSGHVVFRGWSSFLAGLALCLITFADLAYGAGGVTMPFRYRNTEGGATISSNLTINDCYYDNAGAYCGENHRDPDGQKYGHAHLPHLFPFTMPNGDVVTAAKSDWAWDAAYTSYTRVSGSTFTLNCFAHAADAPTVMFKPGWEAFTKASSQCEPTNKTKSYGNENHVIKITSTHDTSTPEACSCTIWGTSEKNASSGVYTHGWGPVGIDADKPVRKHK